MLHYFGQNIVLQLGSLSLEQALTLQTKMLIFKKSCQRQRNQAATSYESSSPYNAPPLPLILHSVSGFFPHFALSSNKKSNNSCYFIIHLFSHPSTFSDCQPSLRIMILPFYIFLPYKIKQQLLLHINRPCPILNLPPTYSDYSTFHFPPLHDQDASIIIRYSTSNFTVYELTTEFNIKSAAD